MYKLPTVLWYVAMIIITLASIFIEIRQMNVVERYVAYIPKYGGYVQIGFWVLDC